MIVPPGGAKVTDASESHRARTESKAAGGAGGDGPPGA